VPIFFTSGFLISRSYERNPNLKAYACNRFLRIFPGMWISTLLSVALILALYPVPLLNLDAWAVAQGTIFQDWNPGFLRGYGVGVANGAMWTIPVEFGFYAASPCFTGSACGGLIGCSPRRLSCHSPSSASPWRYHQAVMRKSSSR
jgi:peptidoglycan/LPS O-acetylase OafA/YrhL